MTSTEALRACDIYRAHVDDIDKRTRSLLSKLMLLDDERAEFWLTQIARHARKDMGPHARLALIVGELSLLAKDAAAHEVTARE